MAKLKYINATAPDIAPPVYRGIRYKDRVPATLDLAERAALSVNVITESGDPEFDHEIYWIADLLVGPPAMFHTVDDHIQAKLFAALPLCRTACGSEQNLDVEHSLLQTLLKMQGPDGLIYIPIKGRPWALPEKANPWAGLDFLPTGDHWCSLVMNGWNLATFCNYAAKDPNGPWAEAARRLVEGLIGVSIVEDDSAYLFLNCTEPGRKVVKPENPPVGLRCAINGWVAYGLVQAHRSLGIPGALDLAHKMMRYIMLKSGYFEPDGAFSEEFPGSKRLIHFHAHTRQIDTAFAVASCTEDPELLDRALKAYDYACSMGEPVLGFFPEWLQERKETNTSEICEVADMIGAALKLCNLGYDKWEDVDRWTRNQFAECQFTQTNWLCDGHLQPVDREVEPLFAAGCQRPTYGTTDRVAERTLGSFSGWPSANDLVNGNGWSVMHCCTGNGVRTVYHVWHNIVHWTEGRLRVNLLMNRASPWADIDSHIPFSGRVDIKVKQDLTLEVRIPLWAETGQVHCTVNKEDRSLNFESRYARIGEVCEGDRVQIKFPIAERSEILTIEKEDFTVTIRGNDVVHIDPPGKNSPLYQKGHFRFGETLWKDVNRWVPEKEIPWL